MKKRNFALESAIAFFEHPWGVYVERCGGARTALGGDNAGRNRFVAAAFSSLAVCLAGIMLPFAVASAPSTSAMIIAHDLDTALVPAPLEHTAGSRSNAAPIRSPDAVHAVQQLMSFLTSLRSRDELTPEIVGRGFGVPMVSQADGWFYTSPALGGGWNYGIAITLGGKTIKRGFSFGFYNPDRRADPTPVCLLTLENLRRDLVAVGFDEVATPTEIGGTAWINFARGDIDLIIAAQDQVAAPNGERCLREIATADG